MKKRLKISKRKSKVVNRSSINNTLVKNIKDKGTRNNLQYTTQQTKYWPTRPDYKLGMSSCAPEGKL